MGQKRMKELYDNSERINIDDNSKIVILSDVHRGDGGYADSLIGNRNIYFAALYYYYDNGYTLIEAGDGDELWKNKGFMDIAYNYKGIFKMLCKFNKENRLHMIYGNHDERKSNKVFMEKEINKLKSIDDSFGKDFINIFGDIIFKEGVVLNYTPLEKEIFILHGHQVDTMNYDFCILSRFLVRYVWRFLEGVAGFKAPTSPANNYKKGGKIDKKLEKWAEENEKFIICGHTHNSRFPKVGKTPYFNDGCCVLPYSISTLEICDGKIKLVKWSTYVRKDTTLYIDRSIIAGPEKLESYLKYTN